METRNLPEQKTSKKVIKNTGFILLLLLLTSAAYPQENSRRNISQAVMNSLPEWLEKIPAGSETNYGFQSRDEFSRAGLGDPIEVFDLGDEFYTQKDQAPRMVPTGEWRIPVTVDQKIRAMVTVVEQNSTWEIVDFGATGLAEGLSNYANKLPVDQFRRIKILTLYQPLTKFLFYDDPASGPDQIVLLPLLAAVDYFEKQGLQPTKTRTLGEVAKIVRATDSLQNQD
jgi:hypothetical protein